MDMLPTELRRAILEQCDRAGVKSLRLASKSWADLGEDYLLPSEFTSYPYRNDLLRLESISQHTRLSSQIQSLCLNHGEINEWHARHNTYFLNYMRNSEEVSEEMVSAWHYYNSLKKLMEVYHSDAWALDRLEAIFARLPNLKSVQVSLMNCIFYKDDDPSVLKEVWTIPSTRRLPREATILRFANILLALQSHLTSSSGSSSSSTIKNLSHDRLPLEFFTQRTTNTPWGPTSDIAFIETISPIFQHLSTLTLAIDWSERESEPSRFQALHSLSHLLRSTTVLHTLSLSFHGRRKLDLEPLFTSLRRHAFTFTHLRNLTLKEFTSTEAQLGAFLATQTPHLTHLRLGDAGEKPKHHPPCGGVWLDEGSFKGLFEQVEREMAALEVFLLQGDLLGLASNESWELEEPVRVQDLGEAKPGRHLVVV